MHRMQFLIVWLGHLSELKMSLELYRVLFLYKASLRNIPFLNWHVIYREVHLLVVQRWCQMPILNVVGVLC